MENLDFNRIHRFRYDDLKILLDVNSGSIHVIDQPTWDFFDYLAVNNMETAFSLLMDQYGYAEAEAVLDELIRNGQVATQYVDLEGNPTMDIRHNPNGSVFAIEGITSPDGRVLGKMGHSERIGEGLYKNVEGTFDMKMFESAVKYFK